MSSYIHTLNRVSKYAKNNLQVGLKSVYFLDFLDFTSFTYNSDFDITNLDVKQLYKIDEVHKESNLSTNNNLASLNIILEGNQSDINNKLHSYKKNKNIACFVILENGQIVFLGYLIDKAKAFRRVKRSLVNSSTQFNTGAKNDTGEATTRQSYTFEFHIQDLIFYKGSELKLDVLNLALKYGYIKQVTPDTLSNVTITGISYIEKDGVVTTQTDLSSQTLSIGDENYLYGQITDLRIDNNSISVLDVSNLTSLNYLYCYNNSISTLDVSRLFDLTTLRCEGNSISTLDVTNLTDLDYLYCQNNSISTLNVTNLTDLIFLYCQNNSISVLDVTNLTNLTLLLCHGNNLSTAQLDGILSNLVTNNQNNGTLNISNNTGTHTDTTSYNTLISTGWTITT